MIALSEVSWCLYVTAQDKVYVAVSREWKTSFMELLILIYNWVLYNISNGKSRVLRFCILPLLCSCVTGHTNLWYKSMTCFSREDFTQFSKILWFKLTVLFRAAACCRPV